MRSIVEFLEAPFTKEEIEEAVEFAAFENLKQLERSNFFNNSRLAPRDPDDPDSFKVRRGKVGGYTDYFDEKQTLEMEERVRSSLSPVFGYTQADGAGVEPGASTGDAGIVNQNVDPTSTDFSTSISPPIRCTNCLEMFSPSPVPP